jgi:primosomal protein N' (replication factor Y)
VADSYAHRLVAVAPRDDGVRLLGPAEAPLALVRGRYRFRLLVKSPRGFAAAPNRKGSLRLDVDVDPQSFL